MRSPVETRCAGVADMCMGRLYQKGERGRAAELRVARWESTVES